MPTMVINATQTAKRMTEVEKRRGIYLSNFLVDISGGIVEGMVLSQILYWFQPTADGKSKIKVIKNGKAWLVKKRSDWYSEIRITEKQFVRAIKSLIDKGFVEMEIHRFNNIPMSHIRPIDEAIVKAINQWEKDTEKRFLALIEDNQQIGLGAESETYQRDESENETTQRDVSETSQRDESLTEITNTEITSRLSLPKALSKDVDEAIGLWNNLVEIGIKPVTKVTRGTKRYSSLVARLREYGIEDYKKAIDKIRNSDFLQGKHGGRPWKITFDWFVRPNNFPKVLEGNYDNEDSLGDAQEYYKKKRDEEKQKKYEDFKRRFLAMKD